MREHDGSPRGRLGLDTAPIEQESRRAGAGAGEQLAAGNVDWAAHGRRLLLMFLVSDDRDALSHFNGVGHDRGQLLFRIRLRVEQRTHSRSGCSAELAAVAD